MFMKVKKNFTFVALMFFSTIRTLHDQRTTE